MIFNQADAAARSLSPLPFLARLYRPPARPPSFFLISLFFSLFFSPASLFEGGALSRAAAPQKFFPRARIINSVLRGALNSSGNRCSYVLSPSLSAPISACSRFSRDSFPRSSSNYSASRLLRLVCIYDGRKRKDSYLMARGTAAAKAGREERTGRTHVHREREREREREGGDGRVDAVLIYFPAADYNITQAGGVYSLA